jgi:pentatricopeptide repeat protein
LSIEVNTFGRNGNGLEAVDLYRQISSDLLNEVTHICVLNACSHSGLLNEARSIYNEIDMKTTRITTTMVCFFVNFILLNVNNLL